jgi:2-methylisocitrate lyase-like PEP mutase family enzyme
VSKPVNVLARRGLSTADIVGAGAQRISVGGALTWTAVNAFAAAATEIAERGDYSSLGDGSRLSGWLATKSLSTDQ